MKNKFILTLTSLLLFSSLAEGQQRATPNQLRVKTDANGYLVVAAGTQTNPVTQSTFINTRLATDSNGYLQVILSGSITPSYPLAAPTSADCTAPPYSFTGRTTTGLASLAADTWNLCSGGTNVLSGNTTSVTAALPIDVLATGVRLSAADGVLTLLGLGNGNNENLLWDFDNAAANVIAITSGTGVSAITTSGISWQGGSGTASLPTWSFISNPTTGFYGGGPDLIDVSVAGNAIFRIQSDVFEYRSSAYIGFSAGSIGAGRDTTIRRSAAGILRFGDDAGTTGIALEAFEQTPPAAPPANAYRMYSQDNGSGKTQLCVIFSSGAAQCFATQP